MRRRGFHINTNRDAHFHFWKNSTPKCQLKVSCKTPWRISAISCSVSVRGPCCFMKNNAWKHGPHPLSALFCSELALVCVYLARNLFFFLTLNLKLQPIHFFPSTITAFCGKQQGGLGIFQRGKKSPDKHGTFQMSECNSVQIENVFFLLPFPVDSDQITSFGAAGRQRCLPPPQHGS